MRLCLGRGKAVARPLSCVCCAWARVSGGAWTLNRVTPCTRTSLRRRWLGKVPPWLPQIKARAGPWCGCVREAAFLLCGSRGRPSVAAWRGGFDWQGGDHGLVCWCLAKDGQDKIPVSDEFGPSRGVAGRRTARSRLELVLGVCVWSAGRQRFRVGGGLGRCGCALAVPVRGTAWPGCAARAMARRWCAGACVGVHWCGSKAGQEGSGRGKRPGLWALTGFARCRKGAEVASAAQERRPQLFVATSSARTASMAAESVLARRGVSSGEDVWCCGTGVACRGSRASRRGAIVTPAPG